MRRRNRHRWRYAANRGHAGIVERCAVVVRDIDARGAGWWYPRVESRNNARRASAPVRSDQQHPAAPRGGCCTGGNGTDDASNAYERCSSGARTCGERVQREFGAERDAFRVSDRDGGVEPAGYAKRIGRACCHTGGGAEINQSVSQC
jgi:hypothetical protein